MKHFIKLGVAAGIFLLPASLVPAQSHDVRERQFYDKQQGQNLTIEQMEENRRLIRYGLPPKHGNWEDTQETERRTERREVRTEDRERRTMEPDTSQPERERQNPERERVIIIQREVETQREATRLSGTLLPAGVRAKNQGDQMDAVEAIWDVFETAANAAAAGDMEDLVEQFVDADRNRLQDFADDYDRQVDEATTRFRDVWKSKYNDADFEINREDTVYAGVGMRIEVGEIEDAGRLTDWPRDPTAVTTIPKTGRSAPGDGQINLEEGRDVAVVVFPRKGNMPELTVSMIHEAPDYWKIDLPDNLTEYQFRDALVRLHNSASANFNQWPGNIDEAYRQYTQSLLAELYNVEHTAPGVGR